MTKATKAQLRAAAKRGGFTVKVGCDEYHIEIEIEAPEGRNCCANDLPYLITGFDTGEVTRAEAYANAIEYMAAGHEEI